MTPADAHPRLVALNTRYQGQEFVVTEPVATIGRSADCDIRIDQVSVSRYHARIEDKGAGFMVRDLGSRNGIKINDIDLPQSELRHGDVLCVGEVQLRFELTASAAPGSASPPSGPPAAEEVRPMTGKDIMRAAQATGVPGAAEDLPPPGSEPETGPTSRLNLRMVFATVLGVVLAVGGTILALRVLSDPGEPSGPERQHVLLRVGEKKWLTYPKRFGDFSEEGIAIGDDAVAEVRRFGPAELLIIGKSGGGTMARIHTHNRYEIEVRIVVRGRMADEIEKLIETPMGGDERRRRAEKFLKDGLIIQEQKPYLAMRQYERALAVLTPLQEKGPVYLKAKRLQAEASARVNKRWEEIAGDVRIYLKNKQFPPAVDLLDQAVALIPDPADPRHQKAAATRWRVIREVHAREKRARKRGRR